MNIKSTYKKAFSTFLLSLFACASVSAIAQSGGYQPTIRTFPAETYWGAASFTSPFEVSIQGRSFQYSPGSVIRDEKNMIISAPTAMSVAPGTKVRFTVNYMGMIQSIWILNQAEAYSLK